MKLIEVLPVGFHFREYIPDNTKSVTVTGSGLLKFELITFSGRVAGVGMVPAWGTTTLLIDEADQVREITIKNCDRKAFDVYVHYNP